MRWIVLLSTLVWIVATPSTAGNLGAGDRELAFETGFADLDLGSVGAVSLGSADGVQAAGSFGWFRSRRFSLGARVTLVDLESDRGETIKGSTYGAFLSFHRPTSGIAHPFVSVGFGLPGGNLRARYDYTYDAELGVKIYPGERHGLSLTARYQVLPGRDFVPDGGFLGFNAAFRYKF